VRAYIPYGKDWYAYFSRRIAERPNNALFVLRGMFQG
jgi:proline dehydrogenase